MHTHPAAQPDPWHPPPPIPASNSALPASTDIAKPLERDKYRTKTKPDNFADSREVCQEAVRRLHEEACREAGM